MVCSYQWTLSLTQSRHSLYLWHNGNDLSYTTWHYLLLPTFTIAVTHCFAFLVRSLAGMSHWHRAADYVYPMVCTPCKGSIYNYTCMIISNIYPLSVDFSFTNSMRLLSSLFYAWQSLLILIWALPPTIVNIWFCSIDVFANIRRHC